MTKDEFDRIRQIVLSAEDGADAVAKIEAEFMRHPFTGEFVSDEQKEQNRSESLRWYQVLTRSCDPVYLRNRMKAMGQLNSLNDPKVRQEPTP